jgi:hypothetical protein
MQNSLSKLIDNLGKFMVLWEFSGDWFFSFRSIAFEWRDKNWRVSKEFIKVMCEMPQGNQNFIKRFQEWWWNFRSQKSLIHPSIQGKAKKIRSNSHRGIKIQQITLETFKCEIENEVVYFSKNVNYVSFVYWNFLSVCSLNKYPK